jgi:hypothetical protein
VPLRPADDGGGGDDSPVDAAPGFIDAKPVEPDDTPPGVSTCAEAAAQKSYVGCDFWPTVTPNQVEPAFHFAVVVANAGSTPAHVTITGPNLFSTMATIDADAAEAIILPWVDELRGRSTMEQWEHGNFDEPYVPTVRRPGGAYHLVSDVPVIVYQFNPLEFALPTGEFSYTNDASLLLPSTALTGNYRIGAMRGERTTVSLTGFTDGTDVTVYLPGSVSTLPSADGTVPEGPAGGTVNFRLDRGEVVQLSNGDDYFSEWSGARVVASAPVQAIVANKCTQLPLGIQACDHLEETLLPAETMGRRYVVAVPSSPEGRVFGHRVRFIGNVAGTVLTYKPARPPGCPETLQAGELVECVGEIPTYTSYEDQRKAHIVTSDFVVEANEPFLIVTAQVGNQIIFGENCVDFGTCPLDDVHNDGDPALSAPLGVEQYRPDFVFLAPLDYNESYADVVAPLGTALVLDGVPVPPATLIPIADGWGVARLLLTDTPDGVHRLVANNPVGLQVAGYGDYTSYHYPGGGQLEAIATPPIE